VQKALTAVAARVGLGSEVALATAHAPTSAGVTSQTLVTPTLGARVYVPRLRSDAVIVEVPLKGKVLVAVGAMKLWVERAELYATQRTQPVEERTVLPAVGDADPGRLAENTVDVRGLRADDALAMLDSFIDRLYAGDMRVGYVVHGHGTGALRSAVREHLGQNLPYVQAQRPGHADEGGDSVTVFHLS
jgi:DNA mismatch repair protein MutS2